MATRPKKSTTSSKKNVRKKSAPKRTKKKSGFQKDIFIVFGVLLLISLVAFGYFLGKSDSSETVHAKNIPTKKTQTTPSYSTKELLEDIKAKKPDEPIQKAEKIVYKKVPDPKETTLSKPPMQERGVKKQDSSKKQDVALAYRGKKPKLVIIIDDVHTLKQVKAINKLGMKVTPSIFPPYKLAKKSHLLSKQLNHYMVHLPMESGSKQFNKQAKTLLRSFTDEQIVDRVMEIRQLFPKAKYINNHTGSVFTSDYKAMKKLYIALKLEGFVFVDSYTASTSKVPQIAHELGDAYVRRDVFIDNTHTVQSIHKQLKIAVQKAKKNGYAVAIGHPHKTTIKALASAKQILKEVDLVYIDEIYRKGS